MNITILYHPQVSMSSMKQSLYYYMDGICNKELLQVYGSAYGINLQLSRDIIQFANTIYNSYSLEQVILTNTSSTSIECQWPSQEFLPHFLIKPTSNYIKSNQSYTFNVYYQPQNIKSHQTKQIIANINDKKCNSISLQLKGTCIALKDKLIKKLEFITKLNEINEKIIKITNTNNEIDWHIKPIFKRSSTLFFLFFS